jgi:hypothetical protein
VKLSKFYAAVYNHHLIIRWETETETENFKFILRRNGVSIAEIMGSGTTTETRAYSFIDEVPVEGRSVYQLSDVSYGGIKTSYPEIEVDYIKNIIQSKLDVELYPNPANLSISISFNLQESGTIPIKVYSVTGKVMFYDQLTGKEGTNIYRMNTSTYPSSVYILMIDCSYIQKFVIQK